MIVCVEGKVVSLEPTAVHIKTNSGLTYLLHVSINTSAQLQINQNIELFTSLILREDAQILYGFSDLNEKEMFQRLLKINGIGPSTALAICSTFTAESFMKIVQSSDVNSLKMVPGIGPKSAKRILVELGEFSLSVDAQPHNVAKQEAKKALESLGFKTDVINQVLSKCSSTQTPMLVKEALKHLSQNK